jgi:hypothetical protein
MEFFIYLCCLNEEMMEAAEDFIKNKRINQEGSE